MLRFRVFLPLMMLLCLAPAARGQFVFLDANGDGVNNHSDQLDPNGSTDLDVWFVTNENRDGSPAPCATDPSELMTINSYEFVLRALNGRVEFGPMRNRLSFTGPPVCFAGYEDTTNTGVYHNGWGYRDIMPPGRYLVATLTVRIVEGEPSLVFAGRSPLQPVDLTSFGTKCSGTEWDNTSILGEDFFDSSGIGRPTAEAGGPYNGIVGRPIGLNGGASSSPDGLPLTFDWTFGDGGSASGRGVTHTYAEAGTYGAVLTVSDGAESDTDRADVYVATPFHPVALSGGPYEGRVGLPVPFDGSSSFDPDDDPLTFGWSFGDGGVASASRPHHIYAAEGVYQVRLTVSDGLSSAEDLTTATITDVRNGTPTANAGGPYAGVAGRWIQFNGSRSTDPDGDLLAFSWNFGDGVLGTGIIGAHAYRAAGDYEVTLSVSDGQALSTARTTAAIARGFPARAFFDGGRTVVNVDAPSEFVEIRFEPEGASFSPLDIDLDVVALHVGKVDGSTVELAAAGPALEHEDSDGNGVVEFIVRIPRAAFRELVEEDAIQGRTHLELVGGLYRGGSYVGAFEGTFVRSESFELQVSVTPNPFNPQTRLTLQTRTAGIVNAHLFDIRGRKVKSILRATPMPAGRHELAFEARDDSGVQLASGVYFLQVGTPDGTRTGRVVVAK